MGWGRARVRARWQVRATRAAGLAALILPLVISGWPVGAFSSAGSPGLPLGAALLPAGPNPAALPNETLTVQNQTIGNLTDFWGVGVNPGYNLTNISNETQDTPIDWVVWPAGAVGDEYNMVNGTLWTTGVPTPELNDEAQFVAACRSISCHAIFTVPGEINDPQFAAYEVWYTEQVLHFYPAYWEVGNEPFKWGHFNESWPLWNTTTTPGPSPFVYATIVHAYIAAMRGVDPTLQFIGLPGTGHGTNPDEPWLNATISINGPNLSAVAIHDYPGESGPTNATLAGFYASLTKVKTYMVTRIAADERQVRLSIANISCSTCSIQFLVDEFGAGTGGGTWEPFMHSYAEIPYIASELLMMSESNVTHADLFELRSGYNGSLFTGVGLPFPLDSLYSKVLPHYDTLPLNTSLSGPPGGVFAGVSRSPNANSMTLLAVNTNITQAVQLNVAGNVFPSGGTYQEWKESNSSAYPNGVVTETVGVHSNASWVIPPLGVILVSVCRSNASLGSGGFYPLTFCSSGLPPGTLWNVTVGSTTLGSTSGTISFSEPNGSYSYLIGGVPGWSTPNASGNVTVNGAPAAIQLPWTIYTYPVTFNESGLPAGTSWTVTLGGTLYHSSGTNLTGYEPNGSAAYLIGNVSGWRPPFARGSVFVSAGPVWVDTLWTRVVYNVSFHESGLPLHTNWSVALDGSLGYNASGGSIHYLEPNGTYSFTVTPSPGYTPNANSGSVIVRGYPKLVPLTWGPNTSVYRVWLNESGLPAGTSWNVTVNGTTQAGPKPSFEYNETNGTLPYTLGGAAGWAPPSYTGNLTVAGAPLVLLIPYHRVVYNVTFEEKGLPNATLAGGWSVDLNGTVGTSTTTTIVLTDPNGSYAYDVLGEPAWTPNPTASSLWITGNATVRTIEWSPSVAPVTFVESGLWPNGGATTWTVDISGQSPAVNYEVHPTYAVNLTNGTYTYTATTSIPDVVLSPASGNFTENGTPLVIDLRFILLFPVTFFESGLPVGTTWSVDLNGSFDTGNTSALTYLEPNGTSAFSVHGINGLLVSPSSGQVDVAGGPVNVTISFGLPTFPITFSENGLPSGTDWSVALDGDLAASVTPTIQFTVPNGSHMFVVEPLAGWSPSPAGGVIPVAGGPVFETINWTPVLYPVTFTEFGLPTGTPWSVTLDPHSSSSNTTILGFEEPNGTYAYQVGTVPGWTASPTHGSVPVDGGAAEVSIEWALTTYSVTFSESGLPTGTPWSVSLDGGVPMSSNGSTLTLPAAPGTHSFRLGVVPGWTTANFTGQVTILAEGTPTVVVHWTLMVYAITFSESGLPTGDAWSTTFAGSTRDGASSSFVFQAANGSYAYTVAVPSGFTAAPAAETVEVRGSAIQVSITVTANGGSSPAGPALTDGQIVALLAVAILVPVVVLLWLRSRNAPPSPPPAAPPAAPPE
jgi:hypothetical protein